MAGDEKGVPFNGDYYDSEGNLTNLMSLGSAPDNHPKNNMMPMQGYFYASDGSIHNLDELGGGGGGSGVNAYSKTETDALIAQAVQTAKAYTDEQIGDIINGSY